MDLKNIVVATDLSDHCGAAAIWAQRLKEQLGSGRVIVEHVIELSLSSWVSSAFEVLDDPDKRRVAEEKVRDWYYEHARAHADEIVLRAGSCLSQLTEVVDSLDGDSIVVVSMSGKTAVRRFFLGSTAHALASQPPCPVVIVHHDHRELRAGVPIVTGTDLSRNGKHAVAYAADLARALGSPLEIVHAFGAPVSPLVNLQSDVALTTTSKIAAKKIGEQPGLDGVKANLHVVAESPGDAIITRAETLGSDLIVLGHSGESVFVQNVLGSVAQRVLNHTPCSIVVVPGVEFDHPVFQDDEEE